MLRAVQGHPKGCDALTGLLLHDSCYHVLPSAWAFPGQGGNDRRERQLTCLSNKTLYILGGIFMGYDWYSWSSISIFSAGFEGSHWFLIYVMKSYCLPFVTLFSRWKVLPEGSCHMDTQVFTCSSYTVDKAFPYCTILIKPAFSDNWTHDWDRGLFVRFSLMLPVHPGLCAFRVAEIICIILWPAISSLFLMIIFALGRQY